MPRTRRVQFLMTPAEFRRLSAAARTARRPMAELIRDAVRQAYAAPTPASRRAASRRLLAFRFDLPDAAELKRELESAHDPD